MNFSFLYFLLPIIYLQLPMYIIVSLFYLSLSKMIQYNQKQFLFFNQTNIINIYSILFFRDYKMSLHILLLFFLENYFCNTKFSLYFVQLLCFLKFSFEPKILLWMTISICLYLSKYKKSTFHFAQSMVIYYCLSFQYNKREILLNL